VVKSSAFFVEVLKRQLQAGAVQIPPTYDSKAFDDNLDLHESLVLLKRVVSTMILARDIEPALIAQLVDHFTMLVRESESVAKFLETQAMRATKFDANESAFMKPQNKAKEATAAITQRTVSEMCRRPLPRFQESPPWKTSWTSSSTSRSARSPHAGLFRTRSGAFSSSQ
jgi:hypothetical protein